MKQYILPLAFACAVVLPSCFDDKGNYDYVALSGFYVDTTDAVSLPVHSQFDTLYLNPRLVYDGDKGDLSFAWTIYFYTSSLTGNPATLLATTEELAAPIAAFPGRYWVEFRATDKQNGRIATRRYSLTVESSGSGLLVLHERDGLVDLDLVKTRLLTGNIARDEVKRRMYTQANPDHPLTGTPVAVDMMNYMTQRYIAIYTSDDGVNISPDDMSVTKTFRDLFLFAPRVARPGGYLVPYGVLSASPGETSDGMEMLVSDGVCYSNAVLFAVLLGGQPIFAERSSTAGEYRAAPYPFMGFGQIVIYDELNGRFMSGSTVATTLSTVAGSGDKFSFGNIGRELVHLAYGFNGQYMIYAIFKNRVDDGARYLYVMDFYST
ncbi:MAG: hypothetical protein LBF09_02305, partial [Odoribacteraceae bacterium]|nr:hypothetical protein [Odoribacteraceae bacterium]